MLNKISLLAGLALALAACAQVGKEAEPVARWNRENIDSLIGFVSSAGAEGLEPTRYDVLRLEAAYALGEEAAAGAASETFAALAADLFAGTTPPESRTRWHIAGPQIDPPAIDDAMERALRSQDFRAALLSFEPPHPQYAALKGALAALPEGDEAASIIKLNMERWRWMPRDLGNDYVLVNVPAYELVVVRGGQVIDRRKVIVGKESSPTPQFTAAATGIAFNPTWFVPGKIVAGSVGKLLKEDPEGAAEKGYYVKSGGGVRQQPGDGNALGAMKLLMPNPYAIFLHDTPSKALFARDKRAFSHGCIRVDGALDFASIVLGPDWSREQVSELVATKETVTVDFTQPLPVYVVYFTAEVVDGRAELYPDVYGLDRDLLKQRGIFREAQMEGTAGCEEGQAS